MDDQAVAWTAPGRVNLIGEHVDYNDGPVLPFAIAMGTTATVARREGGRVTATSTLATGPVEFDVRTQPGDQTGWGGYVAAVVWALRDAGVDVPGLDVRISGDLPAGAGLSSSAALQCALACALDELLTLALDRREIAALARQAENAYVGVPTGVMDQLASVLARTGHAMLLDCRTLEVEHLPLRLDQAGLRLIVVDTHSHHDLADGAYADRRAACEAAAATLGLASLREATLDDISQLDAPVLRRRAQHVVTEMERVRDVADLLRAGHPGDIGAFLTASHESLRDDFEVSCDELDVSVEAALSAGALGARMTGGGFGGSAIVLARTGDLSGVLSRIDAAFEARGWRSPDYWAVSPAQAAHAGDE